MSFFSSFLGVPCYGGRRGKTLNNLFDVTWGQLWWRSWWRVIFPMGRWPHFPWWGEYDQVEITSLRRYASVLLHGHEVEADGISNWATNMRRRGSKSQSAKNPSKKHYHGWIHMYVYIYIYMYIYHHISKYLCHIRMSIWILRRMAWPLPTHSNMCQTGAAADVREIHRMLVSLKIAWQINYKQITLRKA